MCRSMHAINKKQGREREAWRSAGGGAGESGVQQAGAKTPRRRSTAELPSKVPIDSMQHAALATLASLSESSVVDNRNRPAKQNIVL